MIVDSSVIIAILTREPDRFRFYRTLLGNSTKLSAASYLEISLKIDRTGSLVDRDALDRLLDRLNIEIEPVTVEQAKLARQAFQRFGRGRHPAALNFGDCFVYALAKAAGAPLLFKGNDFSQTDLPLVEA